MVGVCVCVFLIYQLLYETLFIFYCREFAFSQLGGCEADFAGGGDSDHFGGDSVAFGNSIQFGSRISSLGNCEELAKRVVNQRGSESYGVGNRLWTKFKAWLNCSTPLFIRSRGTFRAELSFLM